MDQIKVLIVDDHPLLRQGLTRLLELEQDIKVVGQAKNGEEALAVVEKLQPDVILLDINMPGMNGIETTRILREQYPNVHVLALTFTTMNHM